jgi:hypothetical protein
MALQPFVAPWPLFQFLDPNTVGLLERRISPSQGLCTYTGEHKHRINAHKHTVMPWVEFEPTILVFELEKTVHAVDRAATVIGIQNVLVLRNFELSLLRLWTNWRKHQDRAATITVMAVTGVRYSYRRASRWMNRESQSRCCVIGLYSIQ